MALVGGAESGRVLLGLEAANRELADQLDEAGIVDVGADQRAQAATVSCGYRRASFPFRSRWVGGPQLGPTTGPRLLGPVARLFLTTLQALLYACGPVTHK